MDELSAKVEVWKKIVDVQQHFNDLELRIRNFALIVTGAFLGLGGYAIKDGGFVTVVNFNISSASLIVAAALVPLIAFYLMDRLWYHRLLEGSVTAGISAEDELNKSSILVSLGTCVSTRSPFVIPFLKWKVHSRHKMDGFYGLLCLAIIVLTLTLAIGIRPSTAQSEYVSSNTSHLLYLKDDNLEARKICENHAQYMLSKTMGVPGSVVTDPYTGRQAVLVAGHWSILPRC
ncbi:hypothetical protein [Pseudomonas syringae]|uniref:hypothetical protein n=1 Tax=Pseudomonas syringae TaxID=317 RepID=UPI0012AD55B6|nr:hypothetical protein [Pseudomonas syringae]NVL22269.1 hypothetical protein [Pseudomonas syringae pv. actinidiae]